MRFLASLALFTMAAFASPAVAQEPAQVVAVPQLATPENVRTDVGYTGTVARQVADVIASDLRTTREVVPLGPEGMRVYPYAEATAPAFREWRKTGAKAVVTGFVRLRPDGRLTVGCYLHDIAGGRELTRQGFIVAQSEWRRAAHRCSDAVYAKLSGRSGWFDTRIVYVAESGAGTTRVKRIAMMDSDGTGHRYLTGGESTVLTPRLSPTGDRIAYVSFTGGQPHIRLIDVSGEGDRALMPSTQTSFAPRFSPDGQRLVFSMSAGRNTDIYVTDLASGGMLRLTSTPGIDTSPSYSPDGRRIVFESDRSGTPQLYVMNADGTGQQRISFGVGRYSSPAWSPDGDWIAFTRTGGDGLRIGIVSPSGSGEKMLTSGPQDEGPSWGAGSRYLLFQRTQGTAPQLFQVAADGGEPRRVLTPQGGSDPEWSAGGAR